MSIQKRGKPCRATTVLIKSGACPGGLPSEHLSGDSCVWAYSASEVAQMRRAYALGSHTLKLFALLL
jgi:hypothetical protein